MKDVVDLIAILDRSGSMRGKESDVVGGFNKFIEEQRKLPGNACVTLVLFDDRYEVVHNRKPIQDVPELTEKTYFTRDNTALYDAIGRTLKSAVSAKKAIVFIFTDGQENASRNYNKASCKELIEQRQKAGWEIHFIGAEIDAFAEGAKLGIPATSIMRTTRDAKGLMDTAYYMSSTSAQYRASVAPADEEIPVPWQKQHEPA